MDALRPGGQGPPHAPQWCNASLVPGSGRPQPPRRKIARLRGSVALPREDAAFPRLPFHGQPNTSAEAPNTRAAATSSPSTPSRER